MNLIEYIQTHTDRGACQCGKCGFIGGDDGRKARIARDLIDEHTASVYYFDVCAKNNPKEEILKKLIKEYTGEFNEVDLFDREEHSYIEIGGWLGDQELALRLMGLMKMLGICEI